MKNNESVTNKFENGGFRDVQLKQIKLGLDEGLDVSVYADPVYDWRQMRELREGLKNGLDVGVYKNNLYDWNQMKEIRLGLQNGVDVNEYKSLVHTSQEMKAKRLELEQIMKRLSATDTLILKSVRPVNGRVDYEGSVYVKGDVNSEYVIKAAGDVEIEGYCEKVRIEAGGNIILHNAAVAKENNSFVAGGDITGTNFNTATLKAGGSIHAVGFFDCEVIAGGTVEVSEFVAGGTVEARYGITAGALGNRAEKPTTLRVGVTLAQLQKRNELENKKHELEQDIINARVSISTLKEKIPKEFWQAVKVFDSLEQTITSRKKDLDDLNVSRGFLEDEINDCCQADVVCNGEIFGGVKIIKNGTEVKNYGRQDSNS